MSIPFDILYLFFFTAVALALVPGPDNIFVLTQSAIYGRLAGLLVTLGLCTGVLFHTSFVVLGVATIFSTSTLAFTLLKIFGAAYLTYLAWEAFQAGTAASNGTKEHIRLSAGKLYTRGVIMNVTNPKVGIFFLAFLPQFADPNFGNLEGQIIHLGIVFILATLLIFSGIAWFSGFMGEILRKSKYAERVINRIAGIIFIGLAVRLIITMH